MPLIALGLSLGHHISTSKSDGLDDEKGWAALSALEGLEGGSSSLSGHSMSADSVVKILGRSIISLTEETQPVVIDEVEGGLLWEETARGGDG